MQTDPFDDQPAPANDASGFFDSGAASCRFTSIGDAHVGVITDFKESQQRDIKSKEPAFWPDGNPKMMLVVTIQTQERDDQIEDDDGERRLYVNKPSGMFAAIGNAIKMSKGKFAVGGTLAVKYVKNGKPKNPGFSPPKEYIARYTPPGASVAAEQPRTAQQQYIPASQRGDAPTSNIGAAEQAVKTMRSAAIAAFKAKNPGKTNEELSVPWKEQIKAVFGDRDAISFSLADWEAVKTAIERPPERQVEAPFGEEVAFDDPSSIPF